MSLGKGEGYKLIILGEGLFLFKYVYFGEKFCFVISGGGLGKELLSYMSYYIIFLFLRDGVCIF